MNKATNQITEETIENKEIYEQPQSIIERIEFDINAMSDKKIGDKFEKPNLDGKIVTIQNIKLISTGKRSTTMDGAYQYEPMILRVYYDAVNFESYGGLKQFIQNNQAGEPVISSDAKNQASKLFKLWLNYKKKNVKEVSVKEFLLSLVGMKCKLAYRVLNYGGEEYNKNIIVEFLDR